MSCPRSHEGPSIRRAFRVPDVDVGNPAGLRRPAVRMIRRLTPPDCRLGSRPKVIVGFELSGLPRAVCGLSRKRLAGPVFIIVSVRSWRPSALSRPRSPEPSSRRRRWSHVPCSGPRSAGHRYSRCPSCDEWWLRSGWRLRVCIAVRCAMVISWRMSAGLRMTCHVVALMIHRDPRRRHIRQTDGSAPSRRSVPRGDRLVVRHGLRVS